MKKVIASLLTCAVFIYGFSQQIDPTFTPSILSAAPGIRIVSPSIIHHSSPMVLAWPG